MTQMRHDQPSRRIAELESEISELREKLAESERLRAAGEHSMVELGLRLSQENEALRKELADFAKENSGPPMRPRSHE